MLELRLAICQEWFTGTLIHNSNGRLFVELPISVGGWSSGYSMLAGLLVGAKRTLAVMKDHEVEHIGLSGPFTSFRRVVCCFASLLALKPDSGTSKLCMFSGLGRPGTSHDMTCSMLLESGVPSEWKVLFEEAKSAASSFCHEVRDVFLALTMNS